MKIIFLSIYSHANLVSINLNYLFIEFIFLPASLSFDKFTPFYFLIVWVGHFSSYPFYFFLDSILHFFTVFFHRVIYLLVYCFLHYMSIYVSLIVLSNDILYLILHVLLFQQNFQKLAFIFFKSNDISTFINFNIHIICFTCFISLLIKDHGLSKLSL